MGLNINKSEAKIVERHCEEVRRGNPPCRNEIIAYRVESCRKKGIAAFHFITLAMTF